MIGVLTAGSTLYGVNKAWFGGYNGNINEIVTSGITKQLIFNDTVTKTGTDSYSGKGTKSITLSTGAASSSYIAAPYIDISMQADLFIINVDYIILLEKTDTASYSFSTALKYSSYYNEVSLGSLNLTNTIINATGTIKELGQNSTADINNSYIAIPVPGNYGTSLRTFNGNITLTLTSSTSSASINFNYNCTLTFKIYAIYF